MNRKFINHYVYKKLLREYRHGEIVYTVNDKFTELFKCKPVKNTGKLFEVELYNDNPYSPGFGKMFTEYYTIKGYTKYSHPHRIVFKLQFAKASINILSRCFMWPIKR